MEESERRRRIQLASSINRGSGFSAEDSQAENHSPPDISTFTDHLRRSVENAKKRRDGGERRMRNVHARERREAAEETQEFKRRVKEKDRTWYIA